MKNYYVYVKGILNLWALVYTTDNKQEAINTANQYTTAKVLKRKLTL